MKSARRVVAGAIATAWALTGASALAQAPAAPPAPPAEATPAAPATPPPAPPAATPTAPPATPPAATPPAAPATPAASPQSTPEAAATPAPVPLAPKEAVDALSDADIRQALDLIRSNYVNAAALSEAALNRATLHGLLERLGPGVVIAPAQPAAPVDEPFRAEILDDRVGYLRLGSLTQDRLGELEAALGNFTEKKLNALVLDLRSTPPSSDFALAAEFVKRLTPKGKMLFGVRRPNDKQEEMFTSSQDPLFSGVVVTVVNRQSAGAGEVIAAVLRAVGNSLVVGERTAGEAAEFSTLPLRGGRAVRVAVAEVKFADDLTIFPKGLEPDVLVAVDPKQEAEALAIGRERGVSTLVFETERARMNEAALVAGTNPELDEAEAAQRRGNRPRRVADPALQRAVDLVTAIGIFHQQQTEKP